TENRFRATSRLQRQMGRVHPRIGYEHQRRRLLLRPRHPRKAQRSRRPHSHLWGGTPAEAWTALDDLQAAPELKPFADRVTNLPAEREKYATALPKWEEAHRKWDAEV